MNAIIISELRLNTVNYGNALQAYALNFYLHINNIDAYSLFYDKGIDNEKMFYTTSYWKKICRIIYRLIVKRRNNTYIPTDDRDDIIVQRMDSFRSFIEKHIKLAYAPISLVFFQNNAFDFYFVGSDIVWLQSKGRVNRAKFLTVNTKANSKKIAYAASFGKNNIPKENIKYIKKALNDFGHISVRENGAKVLLNRIGIDNVEHVVDPVLLIDDIHWRSLEKPVDIDGDFAFIYMLSMNEEMMDNINRLVHEIGYKSCYIYKAGGNSLSRLNDSCDIVVKTGTIEEWLWLIDHSEYVITDSFHGTVFSTIFKKRFLCMSRAKNTGLNDRITDYLVSINQEDKFIDSSHLSDVIHINQLKWDYSVIDASLKERIDSSKEFLNRALK